MKKSSKVFIYICISLIGFTAKQAHSQTQGIRLANEVRRMTLFVPEGVSKSTPSALVISLHGSGMTALEHMFYTGMNELAAKEQFIIAYPQGKDNDWNVGFDQDYDSGNDVIFIDSLISKLKKHYTILDDQVFAVGLSRGGFFVQRLVAELPGTFAAVASVGAPTPDRVLQDLPSELNTGFLLAHGIADEVVSYQGDKGNYLSAEASFDLWKRKLALKDKPKITLINEVDDGTHIKIQSHGTGKKVTLLSVVNGGHTWPGASDFNIGFPFGLTSHDLDFNQYLWHFFQDNATPNN